MPNFFNAAAELPTVNLNFAHISPLLSE